MSSTDDKVGYRRPPKHTQFKKGQSGNPKGRPKGRKNFRTEFEEELNERITIREGDAIRRISKRNAILKSLVAKGLKGDSKAIALLLALMERYLEDEFQTESKEVLPASDAEVLDRFFEARLASKLAEAESPDEPSGGEPGSKEESPPTPKRSAIKRRRRRGRGR
ncbi:MAG: DUF5681 domain-containing protein [Alphaproteobacteria bacterium]